MFQKVLLLQVHNLMGPIRELFFVIAYFTLDTASHRAFEMFLHIEPV